MSTKAPKSANTDNVNITGIDFALGPPALLESENQKAYNELLATIRTSVAPQDLMEEIWVREFANATWEIKRLRRLIPAATKAAKGQALREILKPVVHPLQLHELCDKWLAGDEAAVTAVYNYLEGMELTEKDLDERAFLINIDTIERLERMMGKSEARRRLLLAEIDKWRTTLARRLRDSLGALEAEYQAIDPPKPVLTNGSAA